MNKPQRKQELLSEAKDRCQLLTKNLSKRVDAAEISLTAKIPFKAMHYRTALMWRTEELGRIACELFERNEVASAMTLTRSCMETAAALWFLREKIQQALDSGNVDAVDNDLKKLIAGSRDNTTELEAINVMTFVDWVDNVIPSYRKLYESMCEFAHPNWSGTSYLFSKPNKEQRWINFGKNINDNESASIRGLINLNQSLHIFSFIYDKVGEMMPSFIKLCEDILLKNCREYLKD